ncbi:hypothetical protein GCM10027284_08800 [Cyclobacterium sediminis]
MESKKDKNPFSKNAYHFHKVIEGFNWLVEKKAVVIVENNFLIYNEVLPSDPEKRKAWVKNAYIYARLKLNLPEGVDINIKDIETGGLIEP